MEYAGRGLVSIKCMYLRQSSSMLNREGGGVGILMQSMAVGKKCKEVFIMH